MSPRRARSGDVAIVIEARCDECERLAGAIGQPMGDGQQTMFPRERGYMLFEMLPGPDGIPWFLCGPHWFEGLRPNDTRTLGTMSVLVNDPPPPKPNLT